MAAENDDVPTRAQVAGEEAAMSSVSVAGAAASSPHQPAAHDEDLQGALLARCAGLTGVTLPRRGMGTGGSLR